MSPCAPVPVWEAVTLLMPPGGRCWGCPKNSLSLPPSQDNKPRPGLWETPQGDKSAPRLPNSVRRPAGTESTSSDSSASPHCTIAARGLCSALSTRLQSDYTLRCPALHAAHRTEPFINTKAN